MKKDSSDETPNASNDSAARRQAGHPMMKCGCAAQGTCSTKAGVTYDPPIPACVIHDCIEQLEQQVDFTNRRARCSYYGKKTRKNESNYGCVRKDICDCEQPSNPEHLAFFEYRPEKEFDEFYCGCHSWD